MFGVGERVGKRSKDFFILSFMAFVAFRFDFSPTLIRQPLTVFRVPVQRVF